MKLATALSLTVLLCAVVGTAAAADRGDRVDRRLTNAVIESNNVWMRGVIGLNAASIGGRTWRRPMADPHAPSA